MYKIYKHTNIKNNKSYIGITKNSLEQRWQKGYGYNTQPKFYRAIQKYGWEGFNHEILEEVLKEEEAIKREEYYIKFHDSYLNGYNACSGSIGSFGKTNSKTVLQIDSNLKIVKKWKSNMEVQRELGIDNSLISDVCLGKNVSSYGYYWIYEEDYTKDWTPREKIYPHSKRVRCIETGIIYPSGKAASKALGYPNSKMVQRAANPNSRYKTGHGYHWEYLD